jgi:hypothetical protein
VHVEQSVVVPVVIVSSMPVTVVHVVHVVTVGNRDMSTALAVHVGVFAMLPVLAYLALIRVAVMLAVQMPVVDVVDVITVRDCHVPAALTMRMVVCGMRLMLQGCRHFTHLHDADHCSYMTAASIHRF